MADFAPEDQQRADGSRIALPRPKRATVACTACRKRQVRCEKAEAGSDCRRCQKMGIKCEYVPLNMSRAPSASTSASVSPTAGWAEYHADDDARRYGAPPPQDPPRRTQTPTRGITPRTYPTAQSSSSGPPHASGLVAAAPDVSPPYTYHTGSREQWAPASSTRAPYPPAYGIPIAAPAPQWSAPPDAGARYATPSLPAIDTMIPPDPRMGYARTQGPPPPAGTGIALPRLQTTMSPTAGGYRRAYTPAPAESAHAQWPARSATPGAAAAYAQPRTVVTAVPDRSPSAWGQHQQQAQWSPTASSPATTMSSDSYYTQSPVWQQYDAVTTGPGMALPHAHASLYAANPRHHATDQSYPDRQYRS